MPSTRKEQSALPGWQRGRRGKSVGKVTLAHETLSTAQGSLLLWYLFHMIMLPQKQMFQIPSLLIRIFGHIFSCSVLNGTE